MSRFFCIGIHVDIYKAPRGNFQYDKNINHLIKIFQYSQ